MNENLIKQPTSRMCFMCGRDNEVGLKMEWYNNVEKNHVEGEIISRNILTVIQASPMGVLSAPFWMKPLVGQ